MLWPRCLRVQRCCPRLLCCGVKVHMSFVSVQTQFHKMLGCVKHKKQNSMKCNYEPISWSQINIKNKWSWNRGILPRYWKELMMLISTTYSHWPQRWSLSLFFINLNSVCDHVFGTEISEFIVQLLSKSTTGSFCKVCRIVIRNFPALKRCI